MSEKKLILPALLVAVISVSFLIALRGQTSKDNNVTPSKTPVSSEEDDKKDFPSVEYANQRPVDEARKVKSQKYGKYQVLYPDITEDETETLYLDWWNSNSLLPVSESEIVALGKVVTNEAHLSVNKHYVYSEIKIEIEKVFKNSCKDEFDDGKYLRAERDGGIVIFPSGKRTWFYVVGQRMPKTGSRYLFLLTHRFPSYGYRKQELFLLTGYELKDGRVYPLDSPFGDTSRTVTAYKGKEESVLLNDLQKALESSAETPK